jgi:3-dehydroquinate dehydratase-2
VSSTPFGGQATAPSHRFLFMASILVLNGPNLNLLGTREPGHYGRTTLASIEESLRRLAEVLGLSISFRQSNAEHELIDAIHRAPSQGVGRGRRRCQRGRTTLASIEESLRRLAEVLGLSISFRQSNAEHELIDAIHRAPSQGVTFILFNPAAFTHTSVALRDALAAVAIPFIEVHLSNVHAREPFRRHSYFSDLAAGVISGLGALGYELALRAAADRLARDHTQN